MGMCQSRPKASAPRAKELHTQIQTEDWPGLGDRGLSAPPGLGTLWMGSCPRCGEPSDREDKLRAVGRPGLLPGGEKPEPLGDSAPAPPSMSQTINRHRGLGWSKAGAPTWAQQLPPPPAEPGVPFTSREELSGPPAPPGGPRRPSPQLQLGGGSADRRLKIALPAPPVLSPLPAGVRLSGPRTGSKGPTGTVHRGTKP